MFKIFGSKAQTFKPKKSIKKGTKQYELHQKIKETLGSGDLTDAIKLPPDETLFEWLSVNTIDFFNQSNLLYGSITEFCTPKYCPSMSAGPQYEFLWADGKEIKKPIRVSAPAYVDYLMTWIQVQLDDEDIFPTKPTEDMPKNFLPTIKAIFKRLFRVYAHIYYSHMDRVSVLGVEAHLNTAFRHFYLFIKEFNLVDKKEMLPLQNIIDKINARKDI
ncbi:hypothetical protein ACTFIW_010782 [Dictyostelium discoideum]|uniref:MOB kinase activator-like 1 homolog C n=2 Tax=Dictyostelium TaxID=5782 RepID=MOB1C_DICDI|nr:Mps1 binder-like protein [Dictyostelium discoideum AX4]Q54BM4.1 RecName: Full=MOB kinase activator-like 1 homolog C; AltName: Full=Mps one binder kinase activator-like 1 homolog C [Dictyostelium discoideum]EAL60665.1 Mps1 binder-like protein [Dictyostelium discoideum AX4]|eukprot:XP_629005.1 Mps1 binder-like protein [Dictyostelium discoideum AX4]